jgi:toxin ParE1/3/4
MTVKKYEVYLIEQAESDLYAICSYVASNDSEAAAEKLFKKLTDLILKLETLPERGRHPQELLRIGLVEFQQLGAKPYRIIYQNIGNSVYVHAILDGRRDLEDYLMQRIVSGVSV